LRFLILGYKNFPILLEITVIDIGNGVSLEKVDKFCYLGDMLDADGGCDSAATKLTTRVRSAWKKFREYLPILTGKGFSLKLKARYMLLVWGVV